MTDRRVGLLGGSFDPIHLGHIAIAKSFLSSGYIDDLWILVNPFPPHKQALTASYEHRKRMVVQAFNTMEKVTVSTIEEELPKPNYSIQTIDYIRSRFPNYKLSFCLGEDSLKSFHNWKSYSEILKYVDLLVAKRSDSVTIPNYLEAKVRVIEHSAIDISSTQVRQALLGGDSVTSLLDQATIDYILEHKLYQKYEFK